MATATPFPEDTLLREKPQQPGRLRRWTAAFLRFCKAKPLGAFGLVIIAVLLAVASAPGWFALQEYDQIDIVNSLQDPSWDHPFGTDNQGRDVFSRVMYGARTSVFIGFGAVAVATVLATIIGIASGYFTGLFDLIVQRILEVWMAFPGLIFIIFLVAIFGSSTRTVILTLGLLFTAGTSRVIRSGVIGINANAYIEAARAVGASDLRIMVYYILPNVMPIILIGVSVQIGAVILVESSLAYLGYGVPPPFPSWGKMLQDGQVDMPQHPYLALFPGLAIALTIYSFNMLGDALRDVMDPRLRGA